MNLILYIFFCSLFLTEFFFQELQIIPKKLTYILDLFPIGIFIYLLLCFAIVKKTIIPKKYVIVFIFYVIVLAIGLIINGTNPIGIIVGSRFYLKQLPLFLLPFVLFFTKKELANQLKVILIFVLIQTPIALYQRIFKYSGVLTGDVITGTTGSSTTLTIIVLFSLTYLYALKLNDEINIKTYIVLSLWIFIAATINETKVTFLLTPFLFMFTSYLKKEVTWSYKIKRIAAGVLIVMLAITIFVPIYDYFMKPRTGFGIVDFFLKKDNELTKYMYKGTTERERIRRGDALYISIKEQSKDIGRILFGLGMANVVESGIYKMNQKQKKRLEYRPEMLAITTLIWELGICGSIMHLLMFILIFYDSKKLKNSNHDGRVLGLCWCTVTVMMIMFLFYTNYLRIAMVNYIYWYLSGVVVSRAYIKTQKMSIEYS
jgi:hypothetical protein